MSQITYVVGINSSASEYKRCSIDKLLEMIEKKENQEAGMYELFGYTIGEGNIYNVPYAPIVKPYFDYDLSKYKYDKKTGEIEKDNSELYEKIKNNKNQILSDLKDWICEKLGKTDCKFAISQAHKKNNKISYHIVVYNYKIKYEDMINFKKTYSEEMKNKFLDLAPYGTSNQKFRIIQTEKRVNNKFESPALQPINSNLSKDKHIISYVTDDMPLLELPNKQAKKSVVKTTTKIAKPTNKKNVSSLVQKKEVTEEIDEEEQKLIDREVIIAMKNKVKDSKFKGKYKIGNQIQYRFDYNHNNKCPACNMKHDHQGLYVFIRNNTMLMRGQSDSCARGDKDATVEIGQLLSDEDITPKEEVERDNIIEGDVELDHKSIVDKIKELAGEKFLTKRYGNKGEKKAYFCFTGTLWEMNDRVLRDYISIDIFKYYSKIIESVYQGIEKKKYQTELRRRVRDNGGINNIVELYENPTDIVFDAKPHLFGLKDKVIDLKTYEIRDYKPNDYITMTSGYKYRKATNKERENVETFLKSVFMDSAELDMMKQILSNCIDGETPQKLLVYSGTTRNGKGTLNRFVKTTIGDYFHQVASALLSHPLTANGTDEQLSQMSKKRYVVASEFSKGQKLNEGTILKLTGGDDIIGRGLYSSDLYHYNHSVLVIECNEKPDFQNKVGDNIGRRLIDIPFRTNFTDLEEKYKSRKDKYTQLITKETAKYNTQEWRDQHKYALLEILLEAHKKFASIDNNYSKILTKDIVERGQKYVERSNDVKTYMDDHYEKTDIETDILHIKDIYDNYIEFYNIRTYKQKQERPLSHLKKELKDLYEDCVHDIKRINGKKYNGILQGFRMKEEDNKLFPDSDDDSDSVEVLDPKNTLESKPSKILKTNLFKKTENVVKQTNTTVTKTIKQIPKELDKIPSMTIKFQCK